MLFQSFGVPLPSPRCSLTGRSGRTDCAHHTRQAQIAAVLCTHCACDGKAQYSHTSVAVCVVSVAACTESWSAIPSIFDLPAERVSRLPTHEGGTHAESVGLKHTCRPQPHNPTGLRVAPTLADGGVDPRQVVAVVNVDFLKPTHNKQSFLDEDGVYRCVPLACCPFDDSAHGILALAPSTRSARHFLEMCALSTLGAMACTKSAPRSSGRNSNTAALDHAAAASTQCCSCIRRVCSQRAIRFPHKTTPLHEITALTSWHPLPHRKLKEKLKAHLRDFWTTRVDMPAQHSRSMMSRNGNPT